MLRRTHDWVARQQMHRKMKTMIASVATSDKILQISAAWQPHFHFLVFFLIYYPLFSSFANFVFFFQLFPATMTLWGNSYFVT